MIVRGEVLLVSSSVEPWRICRILGALVVGLVGLGSLASGEGELMRLSDALFTILFVLLLNQSIIFKDNGIGYCFGSCFCNAAESGRYGYMLSKEWGIYLCI